MNMLIGARAVQGVGAGGINMLIDMIICDLVPMRERASLMGLLFLTISIHPVFPFRDVPLLSLSSGTYSTLHEPY
jgi:MFS family permease